MPNRPFDRIGPAASRRRSCSTLPVLHLVAVDETNLPKLAALWHALQETAAICEPVLIHTGRRPGRVFDDLLEDLGLPEPAISLGVSGGSHAMLTGRTMMAAEKAWIEQRPELVVVAGDADGAMAAGLAARKLRIPLAHLDAGLRRGSRDRPEEINRRVLDAIADLLWAPDHGAAQLLVADGFGAQRVRAVGNALVDSVLRHLPAARGRALPPGLSPHGYGVLTLRRASTMEDSAAFARLLDAVGEAARRMPLAWPVHPRLRARMEDFGFIAPPGIRMLPPLRYLDFLALTSHARFVATDSSGVQDEAVALGIPCLTLATSEEVASSGPGTGGNRALVAAELPGAILSLPGRAGPIPLWDGKAGQRMRDHLAEILAA